MTSPALLYGWNPSRGRVYHHLTGQRQNGVGRPLTLCGITVRAAAAAPQVGYVECRACRRVRTRQGA